MSISFYAEGFHGDEDPYVNMSNANAGMVIRSLGLEFDYVGHISPVDLILAILSADPIDTGAPAVTWTSPGKATFIDCAIRPGYHAERDADLMEVAEFARTKGVDVIWA